MLTKVRSARPSRAGTREGKPFSPSRHSMRRMVAPSALVLKCETCGEMPHRVLRGKIGGKDEIVFEGTVKCTKCGRVSSVVTREPKPIEVPIIVSWLETTERTSLEVSPTEQNALGGGTE